VPRRTSVQAHATRRNRDVELMVEFILQGFAQRMHKDGTVGAPEDPVMQKPFQRDDCSDVFDHYLSLETTVPFGGRSGALQLWAQTTCYKGNDGGAPEPNKTYEIRETLVEALGLRRWLREEGTFFRTVHFTVGPANYTYGWFKEAKDRAFDLSLYPPPEVRASELFSELYELTSGVAFEFELHQRFEGAVASGESHVGETIRRMYDGLWEWYRRGLPTQPLADQQANLLDSLRRGQGPAVNRALAAARHGGADIKARAVALLQGGDTDDPAMIGTVKRLNVGNPFLPVAAEAAADWTSWSQNRFAPPAGTGGLSEYVCHLWNAEGGVRLVARRLLLRIHTGESVHYVQDIDIPGLSEHNLYGGEHTEQQVRSVVSRVVSSCERTGIRTPADLYNRLSSDVGLRLLRSSQRLESFNGASIRPSSYYVEEALSENYSLERFRDTDLPSPRAYHGAFGTARIMPYENMKVVTESSTGRPVAILKAKFFRRQEFARRVKEEAYVGFTTKFEYTDGGFEERYPGLPLVMFVDMESELSPPEYAVRRLVTAGWEAFFSVGDLRGFLDATARSGR
jgi:hypothetical protein